METKMLECPKCGGTLEVEDGLGTFFCKYCGNKIIVSDLMDAAYKAKSDAMRYKHEENMQDKLHKEAQAQWERNEKTKERNDKRRKRNVAIALVSSLTPTFIIFSLLFALYINHHNHVKELKNISKEVEVQIKQGNYDLAMLEANKLYLADGWSSDEEKKWDERREEYIRIIKDAQEIKKINPPIDSTKCSKYDKLEMIELLSKAGFKNITTEEISGSAGLFKKRNCVDSLTIDGHSDFNTTDSFYEDSDVKIVYYEK